VTTHLDEELLAQWALDRDTPDDAAADHLRLCARCRDSLREIRSIAGQVEDMPRMESAPEDVWDRISTELGFETGSLQPAPDLSTAGSTSRDRFELRRVGRPTRRMAAVAASVAAVVGIGLGVIGTLLATSNDSGRPTAEAVVRLEPLAGKSGDGNADLLPGTSGSQLKVTATGLVQTSGFYEVWLINEDGKRMVALGVLNPGTGGTFQIPADAAGQGYRIVDVSLEPNDGNPEHSHNSIIRGTLPS
jgi:anti-sigma-K factor RskA